MLIKAAIYAVTFLLAVLEFCCGVLVAVRSVEESGNWVAFCYLLAAGYFALQFHYQLAKAVGECFASRSNLLFAALFVLGFAAVWSASAIPIVVLAATLNLLLMFFLHNNIKYWTFK